MYRTKHRNGICWITLFQRFNPKHARMQVNVYLPYSAGDVLDAIHTSGTMLEEPDFTATGA
jgi:hypothetical protein